MRDYILFYVNGQRQEVRGEAAFVSLTDFLRDCLRLPGTKVVCAEGDCGACTVLIGRRDGHDFRYQTADACIQFLYQLDSKHVVTVEGVAATGSLSAVQQALVDHHGSQCGFCTPGFVMALTALFEEQSSPDAAAVQTGLTGNLCRCTGYVPILEAAGAIEPAHLASLARRYDTATIIDDLRQHADTPVLIQGRRTFYSPRRLEDALDFKSRYPEAVIVSGGTELGVLRNKRGYDPATVLSLTGIPGLGEIIATDHTLAIGANVTWRQIEALARDGLPEFYRIVMRFGSPQIRNVSTLVANVAHGSPIADSLPFLLIMDSEVEIAGPRWRSSRQARRVLQRLQDERSGAQRTDRPSASALARAG
jgi:xanthine dehydrogenase small subunit